MRNEREMTLTPYANKAPAIKAMLEDIAPHKTGCATCGKPTGNAEDFRDDLSMQEYTISRMCQVCQDRVFDLDRPIVSLSRHAAADLTRKTD